jgi:putative colanic acid biosynthesis acetyltransferase WcaF
MAVNTQADYLKPEGERFQSDERPFSFKLRQHVGALIYNLVVTYLPSQVVRRATLRFFGAKIGRKTNILRGTTVFEPARLVIGNECSIGFRCLLDARGWLTIGNRVVIASDTHFLPGFHDVGAAKFDAVSQPTFVEDYAWIASRSTIESGLTIGRGGVVLTCSLVRQTVKPLEIVAGVPAKVVGERPDVMDYNPAWRPWGF